MKATPCLKSTLFYKSQGVCEWAFYINVYSSNLICNPAMSSTQSGRNQWGSTGAPSS